MIKGGLKMPDRQAFLTTFLESMYTEKTTPQIREFIMKKMSATPKHVGNSAMEDLLDLDTVSRVIGETKDLARLASGDVFGRDFVLHSYIGSR